MSDNRKPGIVSDLNMTPEDAHQIAKEAAHQAVAELFQHFDVDITDPDSVKEFRENINWAGRYRKLSEQIGSRVIITVFTIFTGGILALIWNSLKSQSQ